jgi:hypothetical protein
MAASDRRTVGSRVGALLVALANVAVTGGLLFFGLIGNGLRCDDNCSTAPGWRNNPDAWQWDAQLLLLLTGFGVALLLTVGVFGPARLKWFLVWVEAGALGLWFLLAASANG